MDERYNVGPDRPVFWEAIRSALGLPSVWLFLVLAFAFPPLALTFGWFGWIGDTIGQRYEAGSLIGNLDAVFRHDHADGLNSLATSTSNAVSILGLVYVLAGILRAGGWLQIFLERRQDRPLRRFFFGGGRYFFRFFRLWLLVGGLVALLSWSLSELPWKQLVDKGLLGLVDGDLDGLESEWTVVRREWAQAGAAFVLFGLILVWAIYARTRMAVLDSGSALSAGLMAFLMILRHPLRTLRPFLLVFLVELAFVLLVGWVASEINTSLGPDSSWVPIVCLCCLSLLTLAVREILQGARYSAAIQVVTQVVRTPSRPDARSLGGPGGPRYPIDLDESDAYGVSL